MRPIRELEFKASCSNCRFLSKFTKRLNGAHHCIFCNHEWGRKGRF
jgi:hypothetical protein